MNYEEKFQHQQDENFVSPTPTRWDKKWLLALAMFLVVIIVAAVAWGLVMKKSITTPNPLLQKEGSNIPLERGGSDITEKLVRPGKMSFKSEKSQVKVGETFEIKILMDTENSNIVVASARVVYDPEILELTEIEEKDSVLKMAIIKEKNQAGLAEIVRGSPGDSDYDDNDDGYNGQDGLLASLVFKAKKAGHASLTFEQKKSEMYLDDGRGTAMIVDYGQAVVEIK